MWRSHARGLGLQENADLLKRLGTRASPLGDTPCVSGRGRLKTQLRHSQNAFSDGLRAPPAA
ncbi:TPA: hypothetical protein ACFP4Y_000316 [Neisseria bacilliformis]|uniref:hypothetical protein n=1 Tax=Neisseria bacilliformis TaxID=267212 RepID=UPI000B1A6636|nr:hypothetical protein [Neisseria bacilliformis]